MLRRRNHPAGQKMTDAVDFRTDARARRWRRTVRRTVLGAKNQRPGLSPNRPIRARAANSRPPKSTKRHRWPPDATNSAASPGFAMTSFPEAPRASEWCSICPQMAIYAAAAAPRGVDGGPARPYKRRFTKLQRNAWPIQNPPKRLHGKARVVPWSIGHAARACAARYERSRRRSPPAIDPSRSPPWPKPNR